MDNSSSSARAADRRIPGPADHDARRRTALARRILAQPHCFSQGAVSWAHVELDASRSA